MSHSFPANTVLVNRRIPLYKRYFNLQATALEANTLGQTLAKGIKKAFEDFPPSKQTRDTTITALKFIIDQAEEQPLQLGGDEMKDFMTSSAPGSLQHNLLYGIAHVFAHKAYNGNHEARFSSNAEEWVWVLHNIVDSLEDGEELDGYEGDDARRVSLSEDDGEEGED